MESDFYPSGEEYPFLTKNTMKTVKHWMNNVAILHYNFQLILVDRHLRVFAEFFKY